MYQLRLFDIPGCKKAVNVASVPQRSPFRYPGGKTWLIPHVRRWFYSLAVKPRLMVEPFAGGGIVGLTVAFENLAERVFMAELDEQVASVWQVILSDEADWLADRILGFRLTKESVEEELTKNGGSLREIAFRTLLRNRTSHGGIMAPGSGLIKYGENSKGVGSRWYPKTLSKRIRDIGRIKDRIEFVQGNGLSIMRQYAERDDAIFFIDPPYTAGGKRAGRRLYTHNEVDHEDLFRLAHTLRGDFLMTYDNTESIRDMAKRYGFSFEPIPMKNTHHAEMIELLIGRRLEWAR